MRLRIESNGYPSGTKIVNAETGETLDGVTAVRWQLAVGDAARVELEVHSVEVKVEGDLDLTAQSSYERRKAEANLGDTVEITTHTIQATG